MKINMVNIRLIGILFIVDSVLIFFPTLFYLFMESVLILPSPYSLSEFAVLMILGSLMIFKTESFLRLLTLRLNNSCANECEPEIQDDDIIIVCIRLAGLCILVNFLDSSTILDAIQSIRALPNVLIWPPLLTFFKFTMAVLAFLYPNTCKKFLIKRRA